MSTAGFPAAAIAAQTLQSAMRYLVELQRSLENQHRDVAFREPITTDEDEVFNTRKLPALLVEVAKYLTWTDLETVLNDIDLRSLIETGLPDVFCALSRVVLKGCVKTGDIHDFQEDRRCVSCETQLCKECSNCVLDCCTAVSEPELKRLDWQQKDTLAAKRIFAPCHRPECQPPKGTIAKRCRCTEFLMTHKGQHDCQGEGARWHHCDDCLQDIISGPNSLENHSTKSYTFGTQQSGSHTLHEYICSCGRPWGWKKDAICKLCLGVCFLPIVNVPGSLYLEYVNYGLEKEGQGWNQGACYYFFGPG